MNTHTSILVCDDEAHIRQIIALKLRSAGFLVLEARNGQEALAMIDPSFIVHPMHARPSMPDRGAGFQPALVITDFQMPLMTGIELCKALKAREATAHIPALMLTARGYVLTEAELAQTNIVQVISKPFGVRQLLDRVVAMLGNPGTGEVAA